MGRGQPIHWAEEAGKPPRISAYKSMIDLFIHVYLVVGWPGPTIHLCEVA